MGKAFKERPVRTSPAMLDIRSAVSHQGTWMRRRCCSDHILALRSVFTTIDYGRDHGTLRSTVLVLRIESDIRGLENVHLKFRWSRNISSDQSEPWKLTFKNCWLHFLGNPKILKIYKIHYHSTKEFLFAIPILNEYSLGIPLLIHIKLMIMTYRWPRYSAKTPQNRHYSKKFGEASGRYISTKSWFEKL